MQDAYAQIAEFYDLEHERFNDDIAFYLNLLEPGPILEIGVGTGRIAEPLAYHDFEVWGVDASPAMLERARLRLGNHSARLIQASALELDLHRTFPAALLPLNTLWHFADAESQTRCLRVIREHLPPGGLLIVDSSNPLTLADRGSRGELRVRFTQPLDDGVVTGMSATWDDEEQQRLRVLLMYDTMHAAGSLTRTQATLDLRYVFREELLAYLGDAGFRPRHTYGSYDLDPYADDSQSLIVVAEAV
jgi:SAM-dependent methyltransferase